MITRCPTLNMTNTPSTLILNGRSINIMIMFQKSKKILFEKEHSKSILNTKK